MSLFREVEAGSTWGWKFPIEINGTARNHGYTSTPELADEADKIEGKVWIRKVEDGSILTDALGSDIEGAYMTAPTTPTDQLIFTVYPGADVEGEYQIEGVARLPDPMDPSKTIIIKKYETFTVVKSSVEQ